MIDLVPRIRPAEVARVTSLSLRKVQEMAAAGKIPGAAKFDGVWTFDPVQIKAWIRQRERVAACQTDTLKNAVRTTTDVYVLPDENIGELFEQVTLKRRRSGSKHGAKSSNAPPSVIPIAPRLKR